MSQSLSRVNLRYDSRRTLVLLTVVALLSAAIFLAGFYRNPVPTVDGAIRAVEARTILETKSWFPILYQGTPVADHPPLYVWCVALSMKIFGISDAAANFPMHFFSFLNVILIGVLGLVSGLSPMRTLIAVLILCTTRDFVLSSVRGYIEPLVEFFTYSAFCTALLATKSKKGIESNAWSALSGILVFLAFFSKGPPALWPFLFLLLVFFSLKKIKLSISYIGGFAFCVLTWIILTSLTSSWIYWKEYFFTQVLASALEGRGGAQRFEPFYFADILIKFYWPWLPLFLFSIYRLVFSLDIDIKQKTTARLMFLLGAGFFVGFSLVKWKFWYYIAPAYPAFALFMACQIPERWIQKLNNFNLEKFLAIGSALWILLISTVPLSLHKERVPEIHDFKIDILKTDRQIPVYFVAYPKIDHNQFGTSGEWYFKRIVHKIENEESWSAQLLAKNQPAWIITDADQFRSCEKTWCARGKIIRQSHSSVLVWLE